MHKDFVSKLKRIIKVPYYYVPPCPECRSPRTGRFMKFHSSVNDKYSSKMSLKNGELINFTNRVDPNRQFFCLDCGCEWSEYSSIRWLTLEELDEEKKKRGTDELLDNFIENEHKEKEQPKKGGIILNAMKGFIGHI